MDEHTRDRTEGTHEGKKDEWVEREGEPFQEDNTCPL